MNRLYSQLSAPAPSLRLIQFRWLWGLLLFAECARYIYIGWIDRNLISLEVFFPINGFEWLPILPENWFYPLFYLLALNSLLIAFGRFYRFACVIFFILFSYVFLIEKSYYLNHFYLIALISFLMIWVPPKKGHKKIHLYALQWQIGLVYFFGGIAKLNSDWLQANPIGQWLTEHYDIPVIGFLLVKPTVHYLFAYGGLFLDLLLFPALLYRKTRLSALLVGTVFHLINSQIFQIGIFPWLMIASFVVFIPPPQQTLTQPTHYQKLPPILTLGFTIWFLVQGLLPLRHFLYPGNPSWTEEGHRFAWHMKLRSKKGYITYRVHNKKQESWTTIVLSEYLTRRQIRKLVAQPDMILQFAQHLKRKFDPEGDQGLEVYVDHQASLNGRPYYPLIDDDVDLLKVKWGIAPSTWINPLSKFE